MSRRKNKKARRVHRKDASPPKVGQKTRRSSLLQALKREVLELQKTNGELEHALYSASAAYNTTQNMVVRQHRLYCALIKILKDKEFYTDEEMNAALRAFDAEMAKATEKKIDEEKQASGLTPAQRRQIEREAGWAQKQQAQPSPGP